MTLALQCAQFAIQRTFADARLLCQRRAAADVTRDEFLSRVACAAGRQ